MIRRLLAVLVLAGSLVVAVPGHAAAAGQCPHPFWGIYCPTPYLSTGYGAVAQATQVSAAGGDARYGKYSPITGAFSPSTEWWDIVRNKWVELDAVKSTDNVVAPIKGYATVATPLGEASWVTQYFFGYGRWGIYNLNTQLFYPESDWFPVS